MPIDVKKGQMLIRKIQYLLDGVELNASKISNIEKDLMLGYIGSLYDLFLFEEKEAKKVVKPKAKPIKAVPVTKKVEKITPPVPEKERIVEVKPDPKPDPVVVPEPIVEPIVEPVVQKPVVIKPAVVEKPVKEPVFVAPAKLSVHEDHDSLFSFKKATDLSEKLRDRPVSDLNKAFAINDRLLTISKLFDGDDGAFKAVVSDLNRLGSFDEAKIYLSNQVVDKYNWTAKNRSKTAKVFIKTVSRRYM